MKKWKFTIALAFYLGMTATANMSGQGILWVKQVITANSGKFEYTPPYQDYVSLQSFHVQSQAVSVFGTIYTQSAQDICIFKNAAYVASQDSIIKVNLNDFTRMAAVADSGLSKIYIRGGNILVSKQYPVSQYFLEVLDTTNLGLVSRVGGISGDCGSIAVLSDTVFVAVNGGWMGTEGKLAIIETTGWTLKREINFGTQAIGIMQIFPYQDRIISVNKSPYSSPEIGSITNYNTTDQTFFNTILNKNVGNGIGIKDGLLYFGFDYGIGSMNLNTMEIADSIIVPDPGSAFFRYITSATLDTVYNRLYVNTGDYITPGTCLVTTLIGDSLTSYATGISSDAIAVDYREYPLGVPDLTLRSNFLSVYPNPAVDKIIVKWNDTDDVREILITDIMGKIVYPSHSVKSNSDVIAIRQLPSGIYCIIVKSLGNTLLKKFIKH